MKRIWQEGLRQFGTETKKHCTAAQVVDRAATGYAYAARGESKATGASYEESGGTTEAIGGNDTDSMGSDDTPWRRYRQNAQTRRGKALAAYTGLKGAHATDYMKVKTAVLHRYEVNEETCRQRFRQDKKKSEEFYYAWVCRVADLFDKWVKDSKLEVREIIIMEQVLSQVSPEMAVWLKERKPESIEQLSLLADKYVQVRSGENGSFKGKRGEGESRKSGDKPTYHNTHYQQNRGYRNSGVPQHTSTTNGSSGSCSQTNTREKRCYLCGRWGHLQYSCPNKESEKKAMFAGACDDVAWNEDSYKYLKRGTLNGRQVQMLVDTGADRTIVAAGVVKGVDIDSEQKVSVLCVHGDLCSYPTAYVELGADGWKQWAQVVVAPNLPVAVLLGRDICQELVAKGLMVET
uniref:CCHC-type domain-containing protein n=1 Tax=Amphimedon queenslandica TaxID=400682 RepID=A0A1X7V3C9_AMPQE